MNDTNFPEQHHSAAPAPHATHQAAHATQAPTSPLNEASGSGAIGDASDAGMIPSATQATQNEVSATQPVASPLNEASATTATSDACDATAEAPAAVVDARIYNLTVGEAQQLFSQHNRRIPAVRTIQQYCAEGAVDGQKVSTSTGQEWLINDQSLIAFIKTKPELTGAAPAMPAVAPSATQPAAAAPAMTTARTSDHRFEEVTDEPIGETRSLAAILIENAKLTAELTVSKQAHQEVVTSKDETIEELRSDRAFLREEIADKRRLNQDLKDITSQVLELLEVGFTNRNPQLGATASEAPIRATEERPPVTGYAYRQADPPGRPAEPPNQTDFHV